MPKPKVERFPVGTRVVFPPEFMDLGPYGPEVLNNPEVRGRIIGIEMRARPKLDSALLCYVIEVDEKYRSIVARDYQDFKKKGAIVYEPVSWGSLVREKGYKSPKIKKARAQLVWNEHNGIYFYVTRDAGNESESFFKLEWENSPKTFASRLRKCAAWLEKHAKDVIQTEVD